MINGSSRRDLLLDSQNFCRSIPAGAENPSLSRLCYRRIWGSRNRRALILGWAYYLDAFSSYPLRTWLPSVYRGHDNWYTRATALPLGTVGSLRPTFVPARRVGLAVKLPSAFALEGQSPSGPRKPCTPPLPFGRPTPHRNCLPETVPWPVGAGSPHLHRHVYFTEPLSETVPRSLRLSSPTSLTFRHWAGVSPHTWSYDFAETCVFGKQSPGPGHCDPLCEEAPLLPKLRGYFAEFLRESCLAPLGILYLPTCVGFGYRYLFVEGRSSFSWEYGMGYFSAVAPGPDSPPVDEPCGGTLRFSGHWILTNVCVTQADSLASASSTPARANASSQAERSPTDAFLHPTASADRLALFIFGARALDQ
ncbi:hypothetical protein Scep_031022 [Stephania cephalantha]|uniref:Uncharacterized protein n=1 Tax=Stephania cephalantha TaxID=152367 RepID=A0AAP0DTY9_9MAGN